MRMVVVSASALTTWYDGGMTRRPHGREAVKAKKKSGGLLVGMRSGVRTIAGQGGGTPSKRSSRFWNVIVVLIVAVTAVILLRRFGVLSF